MVPIPVAKWHEEQIDELFASLLGKGFNGIEGVNDVHDVSEGGSTLLKDGFKLFG
jgi:protein AATF/BFR2